MTETMEHNATSAATTKPKLLDQVRAAMRTLHYSYRTEQTYLYWIKFFVHWHGLRHPKVLPYG